METGPLISIVIPAFNAEKFITEALESVAQRTYQNFEAIVVDAESADNPANIAERYAARDVRFRMIRQVNIGMAAKMSNFGAGMAT